MTDASNLMKNLRRPSLLIRAARFGIADYNRQRDLKRIVHTQTLPTHERAVSTLIERESEIEAKRKSGDASYSIARHVEVLIALMAEFRMLPRDTAA